ncbi:MAG TPA: AgmX/PglI C-terminal domain-containing protein, partial [Nitrospirota bacterium]
MLEEELAQLQAQIEQVRQRYEVLEGELRVVNAELETFSADRQRFDALRDVCNALDKLGELKAEELFWENVQNAPGHLERAKSRLTGFEGEISGILEKQTSLQEQINRCVDELSFLNEEVRDAYAREERRQEEYVVEREISPVSNRSMRMPWSKDAETERRFHKALRVASIVYVVIVLIVILWKLPPPVRPVVAVVPERLVSMLRKEPPKPEPKPERHKEEKKPEKDQEKTPVKQQEERPKVAAEETQAARKKAESTGVLAFKEAFKDIMDETPAARLGAEARLNNQPNAAAGQARASRSLVALPSTGGSSGGISNAGVSRNIGRGNGNRIGGVGFTRVESSVAGLAGESRPLSNGLGPARTDEEIQIVFDKYKATLYRMYNAELRKNPTLRGKIILRMTIEPGGEVSACTVQSNDLASPELAAQVVERVKKFNFGPKEKVSRITILYPIDFLPGG